MSRCISFFSWCAVFSLMMVTGCHHRGGGSANAITWEGVALTPLREVSSPSTSSLYREGFPASLDILPKRLVKFPDSMTFLEFQDEDKAYAAFQQFSNPEELEKGFLQRGGVTLFRKGAWLGMWFSKGKRENVLREKIGLPGEVEWGALPQGFSSLLHQGRIAHTERVLCARFLGSVPPVSVFAAQFDCRGDSAWIYFAPDMPISFSKKLNAQQLASRLLDFSERGMVGIEGCFDTLLTLNWLEKQKKVLKSLKLRG
jgi:hypothetical protein